MKSEKGLLCGRRATSKFYQKNKNDPAYMQKRKLEFKIWYEKNREIIKQRNKMATKKYSKTDKGKQARRNSKAIRRAREKTGKVTNEQWQQKLKEFNYQCALCPANEKLEQDHIIPLSKGGKHEINNIQPLCRSCNASKSNKL